MFGLQKTRRLIPTGWSISATDDIISKKLISSIGIYPSIDSFEIYKCAHLGNHYSIILIPDKIWSFEVQEGWLDPNGNLGIGADFESPQGLDHYPSIAGAYFAARLSVAEYLFKKRKKASVLILREIHPEYFVSLGVWQVRKEIRACLNSKGKTFESFDSALKYAISKTSLSKVEWIKSSSIIRNKKQKRMSDYLN